MTADVNFVDPIVLSNPVNLDFGDISTASAAAETFVVDTAGTMTATVPANALGGQAAGSIDIQAANALVDIDVDNISTTNAAVFTLGTPTCDYNGGGETACANGDGYQVTPADAATYTMNVGMTLTMTGAATAGALTETFDVNVNFN